MSPKKIAFLSLNYKPSVGGLVRYIESFASNLLANGHSVDVFCSNAKRSDLESSEVIEGVNVYREDVFDRNPLFKAFTPLLVSLHFLKSLRAKGLEKYDLIICRHLYLAFAISFIPSIRNKSVYIIPLVASKLQKLNALNQPLIQRVYSHLISPQLYFIERIAVKRLKNIAVLSSSKKVEVEKFYGIRGKSRILAPGVDVTTFKNVSVQAVERIKKRMGIPLNSFVISTVCRLVEEKNVDMLVEAISVIHESIEEPVFLLIAGDGPLENSIHEKIISLGLEDRVLMLGYCDAPQEVYQVSDLFVLASYYEGFGHVLIEANACGTPVVGFKTRLPSVITATDEIVIDRLNGYIANQLTAEELAKTIVTAILDIQVKGRAEAERVCISHVSRNYTWPAHLKYLTEIIND